MTTTTPEADSLVSLAGSLRQVFNQLLRLLEVNDPAGLLADPNGVSRALEAWRRAVAAQTSGASVQRARELEKAKLEMMGKVAQTQKQVDDLTLRNKELLAQIVKLNKRESTHKQRLLEAEFASKGNRTEAKQLDLEVRELRRRIRELEGGPPLTAAEAAPQSVQDKVEAEAASEAVVEEKPISLAEAIAQHRSQKIAEATDARSAAEAAFSSFFKPKSVVALVETPAEGSKSAEGSNVLDLAEARARKVSGEVAPGADTAAAAPRPERPVLVRVPEAATPSQEPATSPELKAAPLAEPPVGRAIETGSDGALEPQRKRRRTRRKRPAPSGLGEVSPKRALATAESQALVLSGSQPAAAEAATRDEPPDGKRARLDPQRLTRLQASTREQPRREPGQTAGKRTRTKQRREAPGTAVHAEALGVGSAAAMPEIAALEAASEAAPGKAQTGARAMPPVEAAPKSANSAKGSQPVEAPKAATKPATKAAPKSARKAAPKPATEAAPKSARKAAAKTAPKAAAKAASKAAPKSARKAAAKTAPKAAAKAASKAAPKAAAKTTTSKTAPKSSTRVVAKASKAAAVEPAKPAAKATPKSARKAVGKAAPQSASKATPKAAAKAAPKATPKAAVTATAKVPSKTAPKAKKTSKSTSRGAK